MEIEMDIGLKKNKRESRVDTGIRMIGKCEDYCRNCKTERIGIR